MKIFGAVALLLLAAVLGLMELLALADPVGTKLADDGDPLGDPNIPWTHHGASVGAIVALIGAAGLLLRSRKKK